MKMQLLSASCCSIPLTARAVRRINHLAESRPSLPARAGVGSAVPAAGHEQVGGTYHARTALLWLLSCASLGALLFHLLFCRHAGCWH